MRQPTCKKGTEYSARAERALMFCVLVAVRAIGCLLWIAPWGSVRPLRRENGTRCVSTCLWPVGASGAT
jgi:hypothetical protein